MPATTSKIQLILDTELQKKVAEAPLELRSVPELFSDDGSFVGEEAFFTSEPSETSSHAPEATQSESVEQAVDSVLSHESSHKDLLSQISQEEVEDIVSKLAALVSLPPGQLDSESELYLEQQLSELLGFQVSSSLKGQRLLYNTGKVKALPHLKLHPTDTKDSHEYPYAGISSKRSAFGWFLLDGKVSEQSESHEKYYCSLPLYFFPEWQGNHKELKKWFKYRKVVLINPFENRAVVCVVGDIGPNTQSRYQFGASPEAVVEGKFWSPRSNGKILVLFVEDTHDTVKLGPTKISKKL